MLPTTETRLRLGVRTVTAVVRCVNTNSVLLHNTSAGRTAKVRKLTIFNRQPAPITLDLGYDAAAGNALVDPSTSVASAAPLPAAIAAFHRQLPGFNAINGQDSQWGEGSPQPLPDYEFVAAIYCRASAGAASPADVLAQAEIEEFEGPTG